MMFDHAESTAKNIKTFWFKPEDRHPKHIAGQYTQIHLSHEKVDQRGDKRWFTISSSPTDDMVSITTKFASENGSSFKKALSSLKPGATLNLADPMGDFVLPKDKTIPLLFIAGGIGITPFHSIVKWLSDTSEKRKIHLVYAVNEPEELAFQDLFVKYGLEFTPVVGRRLTTQNILSYAKKLPGCLIFISGPEPMTETFVDELQEKGVSNSRLVTDYFPGYPSI
ncbi:FAD-dependent oxidoreductase [Candidatus Saccharibacteria bacterium]|nr:FAD-dependent oxidoreductase [Candidatus Saccharibacteria bacterium]